MNPKHVPREAGEPLSVLGTSILIRISAGDTNGVLGVVETQEHSGGGTPPHIHHREDETFQVLEGEYEFTVAGKTIKALPGATLFAPREIPHSYRCLGSTGGRLLVVLTPGGFEGFFEEIGGMSPQEQQNIPRVVEVGAKYGLEILPPPAG